MYIVTNKNPVEISGNNFQPGTYVYKSPTANPIVNRPHPEEEKVINLNAINTNTDPGDWVAKWYDNQEQAEQLSKQTDLVATVENGMITAVEPAVFSPVELAVSDDDGASWRDAVDLLANGVAEALVRVRVLDEQGQENENIDGIFIVPLLINNQPEYRQITFTDGAAQFPFKTETSATYEIDGPGIVREFPGQRLRVAGGAKIRAYK
jgi:hypothetical protein